MSTNPPRIATVVTLALAIVVLVSACGVKAKYGTGPQRAPIPGDSTTNSNQPDAQQPSAPPEPSAGLPSGSTDDLVAQWIDAGASAEVAECLAEATASLPKDADIQGIFEKCGFDPSAVGSP